MFGAAAFCMIQDLNTTRIPQCNTGTHLLLVLCARRCLLGRQQRGHISVAIRDHTGFVILAASLPISKCGDAEEAEAKAMRLGMQIARAGNFSPDIILSDCAAAVSLVNSTSLVHRKFWGMYEDIRS
jgi:hypothetical protein